MLIRTDGLTCIHTHAYSSCPIPFECFFDSPTIILINEILYLSPEDYISTDRDQALLISITAKSVDAISELFLNCFVFFFETSSSSSSMQRYYPTAPLMQHSHLILVDDMSSFFSYEAERALEGDNENVEKLFFPMSSQSSPPLSSGTDMTDSTYTYAGDETYTLDHQWLTPFPILSQPQQPHPDPYSSTSPLPNFNSLEIPENTTDIPSPGFLGVDNRQRRRSGSSRSISPISGNLHNYGFPNDDGSWRCAYPGCSSRNIFTRACDLRKHYKRHSKHLFCRHDGCPQSTEGGFSSKKDRARHEAKHNPGVPCEWDGCGRVFSRVDNMKDHVRRIHKKRSSSE